MLLEFSTNQNMSQFFLLTHLAKLCNEPLSLGLRLFELGL